MDDVGAALLAESRRRLVRHFPAQVRAALEALDDEQIWRRPNRTANSVGNLVLHICGQARLFLGRGVGGGDYVRDRPSEFSERGPIPRAELLRRLDETVAETERALDGLAPGSLLEVTDRVGEPHTMLSLVLRTSHHWAVHTGQIVYAAKALKEGAFDELWTNTAR